MKFKVGDWVVRKAEWQCGNWRQGATAHCVVAVSPAGNALTLRGYGLPYAWDAEFFDLAAEPHADADLAMALQLATLVERDYVCASFNTHGLRVVTVSDWNNPEADWLREQVMQALLHRGAR